MAYFYNFNFNEDKMYCIPISEMFPACKHRRNIVIRKEDDTIPRTTNPYVEGHVVYKVHEFPEVVYKRCFWMEERDDKKAEEIRRRYLEDKAKVKYAEMKQHRKEHDLKYELYQLRQRVDILEQENIARRKFLDTMNATITMQFTLTNALCDLTKGLAEDVAKLSALVKEEEE